MSFGSLAQSKASTVRLDGRIRIRAVYITEQHYLLTASLVAAAFSVLRRENQCWRKRKALERTF